MSPKPVSPRTSADDLVWKQGLCSEAKARPHRGRLGLNAGTDVTGREGHAVTERPCDHRVGCSGPQRLEQAGRRRPELLTLIQALAPRQ